MRFVEGRSAAANAKAFFGLASYSLRIALIVAYLRSFFSRSMSARVRLLIALGTGFALTSRLICSGGGIILGLGRVRLNGSILVIFFSRYYSPASEITSS